MLSRLHPALLLCALLALLLPASLRAQVGSSTDIITGTVLGPGAQPLSGAQVRVTSIETGITRTKTTNAKGQYTLLFPDGGGQYTVTARYLGMAPAQMTIARVADEDRLVANFTLSAAPTQLQAVTVQGQRRPRPGEDERPTPGSSGRTLSGEQLARLPIDPSDPNAIALLAPGVVGIGATDTTAAGFSVAGQSPDQNLVTLDGLGFEAGTIPQEAVRSTRVVTSTYDVARGQFTGGMVQSTTRGGTNRVSGSLNYSLRDPELQWADDADEASAFGQGFTQHQLSGGVGGPIVHDRAFWFASAQLRRRLNPLQSLTGADALTLTRLGTSPDSVARFLELLQAHGLPASVAAVPEDQLNDNLTGIMRLDWQLGEDHSLMLRGNVQRSVQEGFRTSALAVPSYGGEQDNGGGGAMATLSSVFGLVLNEARLFYAQDERSGDPYLYLPSGQVRVSSELADGVTGVSTLSFGGNPGLPTAGRTTQLEFSDELSLLGVGGHRFKLGTLVSYNGFTTASGSNRAGTFTYNSLDDFAADRPVSFTRTLTPREREGASLDAAVYLGDTWRRSRALQLTYGARVEYSRFLERPEHNPLVEQLFGRRTDRLPSELHVSPRVGFTYTMGLGEAGGPGGGPGGGGFGGGVRGGFGGGGGRVMRGGGMGGDFAAAGQDVTVIRGGIGEFRGRTPTNLFASAIDATGLPSGEQSLVCIGDAVPTADWSTFLLNPGAVPSACADGGAGQPVATRLPTVTVFDDDFGAPRAWRASLGVQRRLGLRLGMNVEASYALGVAQYGARDLNLRDAPAFTLASEGGRPVYVPASTIVEATGATSVLASREHAELAQVLEARSELESRTAQVTLGMNGILGRSLIWNGSYTYSRSSDQTAFPIGFGGGFGGRGGGFGTGASTTAGDPNAVEWGRSDLERRHALTGSLSWFARPWLDVTSIVRVTSGQPYTPRVGGDVNGDGARNDRAFVFDPATAPDTALQHGMARLLEGAPENARACLQRQLGSVAGRNSCTASWTPSLDLQLNLRPDLGGAIGRRMTFMVSLVNPLAGADRLLHGSNGLQGWGQPSRPDATLLYVRGFDAASQRYVYEVNERFGDTQSARAAIRNPFQVGIQARFQIGPDRQREMLMGALGRLSGRPGAGAGGGVDVRTMMERVAPNPVAGILERRDSLQLTAAQVTALEAIADSLRSKTDTLAAELQRMVDSLGTGAELRTIFPRIQPRLQEGRNAYVAAVRSAERVLTAEQWQQLPEWLRNPAMQRGAGMRGPGAAQGGAGRRPPPDA